MKYRVYDTATARTYFCDNLNELYRVAFDLSLERRAAVYFDENATERELIDDLDGIRCRVDICDTATYYVDDMEMDDFAALCDWFYIDPDTVEDVPELAAEIIRENGGICTGHTIKVYDNGGFVRYDC